ncbi:MAG: hypothetical protein CL623_03200 [Arcobacter sp.]|nr:hypothetical protein [Arcobacter sp.]
MGKDKLKLLYKLMKELSVLYVKDEKSSSDIMIDYLKELFATTYHAKNANEALNLFNENKVDIVITDISLFEITEIEIIEKIRKINNDIPIFIITSHKDSKYEEEANKHKVKGYFIKPFSLNKLVSSFLDVVEELDIKKKELENIAYLKKVHNNLNDIGHKISTQISYDIVLETILKGAIELSEADGGTLYLYNKSKDILDFKIAINKSLNINHNEYNKDDKFSFESLRIHNSDKTVNRKNISVICAYEEKLINLDNVYEQEELDIDGVKQFDKKYNYKTSSMLVIPLISAEGKLFGVIQLVNKIKNKKYVSFDNNDKLLLTALSAVATMTTYNNLLLK